MGYRGPEPAFGGCPRVRFRPVTDASVSQELAQLVSVAEGPVTVANAAAVLGREPREILEAVEALTADGTLADSTAGLTAAGTVAAPGPSRHAYLAGTLADLLESQGGDPGRVGKLLVAAGRPEEAFNRLTGAVLDHDHTRGDSERLHLADAAVAAAASARIEVVMLAMPGVGSGPTSSTSTPIEVMPEASACSSM